MNLSDLRRAAQHADTIPGNGRTRLTDVHLRIRTARHRRVAAAAGAVAVALVLTGAVVGRSVFRDRAVAPAAPTTSVGTGWCTPDTTVSGSPRVGFVGLPPEQARPRMTTRARLELSYFGGDGTPRGTGKSDVWVYDDGRLITQREATVPEGATSGQTGYLERCLSPLGVRLLRELVLAGPTLESVVPPAAWLRVWSHGRLLEFDPLGFPVARLVEPETWLPDEAWIDKRFRAYVPTTYSFCAAASAVDGAPPAVVDTLSEPVASFLRARVWRIMPASAPPGGACATMTTDEARHVVALLEKEWFGSGYDGPAVRLSVGLSHRATPSAMPVPEPRSIYVEIEPVLPDGQFTCDCG